MAVRLSQLRSAVRVGLVLAEKYPTEADWEAEMASKDMQETLEAVSQIFGDIHGDLDAADATNVLQTVENHYGRVQEALEPLAERYGIASEDLLVVLAS